MRTKPSFSFVLFLTILPALTSAQITDFKAYTYKDSAGNTLNYRMLKPVHYDSSESYPLVLFLHGAGERGSDNFSQLKWGVSHFADPLFREQYPAFVVAPQVPKGKVWSSLNLKDSTMYSVPMPETPTQPMRLTMELLKKLQQKYAINSDRLYVTGLSMGGLGTFHLIERYPNKFAAAAPVCGGGDVSRAFLLKNTPLWIFHGGEDQVVDVRYSRSMVNAIRLAGGNPGYTEYPDAGHEGAWLKAYRNPNLYKWMFSKELGENKRRSF